MAGVFDRLKAALADRYAIEREIGAGGMATVYLARDLRHNRKVALKVLRPDLAAVVGVERFLAEIETTANLQHPNILPLFDSGAVDSFLFYVMPYVEGESLRDRLDREHQLPVGDAVQIAKSLAEALDYAHRRGVIHRDIKPANVLLLDGKPVLSDFGIALAVGAAGGGRLTETGLSLGTPHYMSPEQATGDQHIGPGADIYALGCVLYEMLVGEPPYTGATPQAVLGKIIAAEPVSARKHRPTIPAHVDSALSRALEKVSADRFANATDFARALADSTFRHGDSQEIGSTTKLLPWRRRALLGWSAAAMLALFASWSILHGEPAAPPSFEILSTEGWDGLTAEVGRNVALAPDGSSMILPVEQQLGLKLRGSKDIVPIPGTQGARDVVYSPDGQWIAYAVGPELLKQPVMGGASIRLADKVEDVPQRVAIAWLDDGTILYETRARTLVRIPEGGGRVLDSITAEALIWMEPLPGARGALTTSSERQLYVVDLRDSTMRPIMEGVLRAWYAPTGHLVYVRTDGAVFAVPFDLSKLEVTGGAIPLFDGVRTTGARADMRLAEDGTLIYVEGPYVDPGLQRLVTVDLKGNVKPLGLSPRPFEGASPSWSPDGQSIVYTSESQVYTYNVALGTTPRQLTFERTNGNPVFSPDGSRILFNATGDGTVGADLFVKNLNDDSPAKVLVTLPANQFVSGWPSDTLVVFQRGEGGRRDLWIATLSHSDSAAPRTFFASEADDNFMVLSPDGSLAAYSSNESGMYQIYVRSFPNPGERTLVSTGGGFVPFWSPDGATLYYDRFDGSERHAFFAARLRRGPVPVVLSTDSLFSITSPLRVMPGSGLHPDGDRWIMVQNVGPTPGEQAAPTRPQRLILGTNFFEELKGLVK